MISRVSINPLPAEVFHPSEYLRDELKARCWTLEQFAVMSRLKLTEAQQLVDGELPVTRRLAVRLSEAFGTSPGLWYRLQRTYDAGSKES